MLVSELHARPAPQCPCLHRTTAPATRWRRVQWKLTGIRKESGEFALSYDTPDGVRTLKARSVALTVPAFVAADLLQVAPSP